MAAAAVDETASSAAVSTAEPYKPPCLESAAYARINARANKILEFDTAFPSKSKLANKYKFGPGYDACKLIRSQRHFIDKELYDMNLDLYWLELECANLQHQLDRHKAMKETRPPWSNPEFYSNRLSHSVVKKKLTVEEKHDYAKERAMEANEFQDLAKAKAKASRQAFEAKEPVPEADDATPAAPAETDTAAPPAAETQAAIATDESPAVAKETETPVEQPKPEVASETKPEPPADQ